MLSLSHATKAKKYTKKRDARAEIMFCLSKKTPFFRSALRNSFNPAPLVQTNSATLRSLVRIRLEGPDVAEFAWTSGAGLKEFRNSQSPPQARRVGTTPIFGPVLPTNVYFSWYHLNVLITQHWCLKLQWLSPSLFDFGSSAKKVANVLIEMVGIIFYPPKPHRSSRTEIE